jgi:hypothetical protein
MAVVDLTILEDSIVSMIHVFFKNCPLGKNKSSALELRVASRTLDLPLFQGHRST